MTSFERDMSVSHRMRGISSCACGTAKKTSCDKRGSHPLFPENFAERGRGGLKRIFMVLLDADTFNFDCRLGFRIWGLGCRV